MSTPCGQRVYGGQSRNVYFCVDLSLSIRATEYLRGHLDSLMGLSLTAQGDLQIGCNDSAQEYPRSRRSLCLLTAQHGLSRM